MTGWNIRSNEDQKRRNLELAHSGGYLTDLNRAVFWSSGGERSKRDPRSEGSINQEIALAWTKLKNSSLPTGLKPYTMMEDLPEGRALAGAIFQNIDVSMQLSLGEGNALIVMASDRMSRKAMGIVNVIGFNSLPRTNLQRIELPNLLRNEQVTHFNIVGLKNHDIEDWKSEWEFTERIVEKHEFAQIMKNHWLDSLLTHFEAYLHKAQEPRLCYDKVGVTYSHFFTDFQAAVALAALNITEEIERLVLEEDTGTALQSEMERLRCCAEFVVRYPVSMDFFGLHYGSGCTEYPDWASRLFFEGLMRDINCSAERYDQLNSDRGQRDELSYGEIGRLIAIMQRFFPELAWERVHLNSPLEFADRNYRENPCASSASFSEFQQQNKAQREQARLEVFNGDFKTLPNSLVISVNDRSHTLYPVLNNDYLRQRPIAERYCAVHNTQGHQFVTLPDLEAGRQFLSLLTRERTKTSAVDICKLKQHAYHNLTAQASGTVTIAGHFDGIDPDFRAFCLPALLENAAVHSIRVLEADQDNVTYTDRVMDKEEFNAWVRDKTLEHALGRAQSALARIRRREKLIHTEISVEDTSEFIAEVYYCIKDLNRLNKREVSAGGKPLMTAYERLYRCAQYITQDPLLLDVLNYQGFGKGDGINRYETGPFPSEAYTLANILALDQKVAVNELLLLLQDEYSGRSNEGKLKQAELVEKVQHEILEVMRSQFVDLDWSNVRPVTCAESFRQYEDGRKRNEEYWQERFRREDEDRLKRQGDVTDSPT